MLEWMFDQAVKEFLYGNLVYTVCSIISIRCLRPAGSEPREAMLSNALHHRFKKRNQTHTKNINGEIWTHGSQKFNKYVTRSKFIFMHVKKNRLTRQWLTDGVNSRLGFISESMLSQRFRRWIFRKNNTPIRVNDKIS